MADTKSLQYLPSMQQQARHARKISVVSLLPVGLNAASLAEAATSQRLHKCVLLGMSIIAITDFPCSCISKQLHQQVDQVLCVLTTASFSVALVFVAVPGDGMLLSSDANCRLCLHVDCACDKPSWDVQLPGNT